jgi:hypothetical protein
MADGTQEPHLKGDMAAARQERTPTERQGGDEYDTLNPLAFWGGLCAVLLLCVAAWFVIDGMRCDPFYASMTRLHRASCQ